MRNRTELVTTTLAESEEEPSDLEDSEEDWKPSDKKKGALLATGKGTPKRKSVTPGKGKGSAKKSKKNDTDGEEDEEDEDDEEDEEDEDLEEDEDDEDEEENDVSGTDGKDGNGKTPVKTASRARKSTTNNKSIPDKDGKFDLYIFKSDIDADYKTNPKLCMWRRDGASLLQKYIRGPMPEDPAEATDDIEFCATSVYSCWEEKRKSNFFEVKVHLIGDKKESKVKLIDPSQLAAFVVGEGTKATEEHNVEDNDEEFNEDDENDDGEEEADEEE